MGPDVEHYGDKTSVAPTRSVEVKRLVMLHERPALPELHPTKGRRECVVELDATGEWCVARYNETTGKWNFPWGRPISACPAQYVRMWAYLDELFAA
jgi:hypothetical protein